MFNYFKKNRKNEYKNFDNRSYSREIIPVPHDGSRNDVLNIVLFQQEDISKITEKCLPKAGHSEFQFHYRALQAILKKDRATIVFTIPTIAFNFPQRVTGSSVKFILDEVEDESKKVEKISEQLAEYYAECLNLSFFENQGFNVEFIEGEIGSIHRHPGAFGFSSIDLDKNPHSRGVIFRNFHAKELYQTAMRILSMNRMNRIQ